MLSLLLHVWDKLSERERLEAMGRRVKADGPKMVNGMVCGTWLQENMA